MATNISKKEKGPGGADEEKTHSNEAMINKMFNPFNVINKYNLIILQAQKTLKAAEINEEKIRELKADVKNE